MSRYMMEPGWPDDPDKDLVDQALRLRPHDQFTQSIAQYRERNGSITAKQRAALERNIEVAASKAAAPARMADMIDELRSRKRAQRGDQTAHRVAQPPSEAGTCIRHDHRDEVVLQALRSPGRAVWPLGFLEEARDGGPGLMMRDSPVRRAVMSMGLPNGEMAAMEVMNAFEHGEDEGF